MVVDKIGHKKEALLINLPFSNEAEPKKEEEAIEPEPKKVTNDITSTEEFFTEQAKLIIEEVIVTSAIEAEPRKEEEVTQIPEQITVEEEAIEAE